MTERSAATGPLRGVRVIEFAGIGPGPFASMLLSDMGADVVSIAQPGQGKRGERLQHARDDLSPVTHYTVIREAEDVGLNVAVDGYDGLRVGHPAPVLGRARDPHCKVELGCDSPPRDPHQSRRVGPARVAGGSRGTQLCIDLPGEIRQLLEALDTTDPTSPRHDPLRALQ